MIKKNKVSIGFKALEVVMITVSLLTAGAIVLNIIQISNLVAV